MANDINFDPDTPSRGRDFDDLQGQSQQQDWRSRLLEIKEEVPTRDPRGFFEQFQVVKTGNGIANLYGYVDNEWKLIGGGLIQFDSSDTEVKNTTSESDLFSFTLNKNVLNKNAILTIELPIVDFNLLSATSDDNVDLKLKFDSTTLQTLSVTNQTGSDISGNDGIIQIDIANDDSQSSQATTFHFNTPNFVLTEQSSGTFDTSGTDITVKVTATFESADSSNSIKVTNKKAKLT